MSRLPATADTIKALGTTGLLGVDKIEHKLTLYHQFSPKIIQHGKPSPATHSGEYYVEGNVTELISGYTRFWVSGRKMDDENIFSISSAVYDAALLWTKVTVTLDSEYAANQDDVGLHICGEYDATELVKEHFPIIQNLSEEGSISNAVAGEYSFSLDNESSTFYNKNAKSGLFYKKDFLTELSAVQAFSRYAPRGELYFTSLKLKSIPKSWSISDFTNGHLEFISGKGVGSRSLILGGNGYSVNVSGYYAKNTVAEGYQIEAAPDDVVRLVKADVFWFRLQAWHRDYVSEACNVMCGKLDLDSVVTDDKERTLTVTGYDTLKDLQSKTLADLEFDTGTNLERLSEVRPINIQNAYSKGIRSIKRQEAAANIMGSVSVKQVGYDVSEGWHVLDFHPYDNMFRFDFGRWFSVVDEGSFEKSTGQVFLSSYDAPAFNNPAKLPAHDGQWKGEVADFTNTPPGSPPAAGTLYAIGSAPTGVWIHQGNKFAVYTALGQWYFMKPMFGDRCYDATGTQSLMFDGENFTTNIDAVNNVLVERNWHGKWASIEIGTEEAFSVGSTNGQYRGGENHQFKKLKGLPDVPSRMLFFVDKDRQITRQTAFGYSYDNGGFIQPHIGFDYVQSWDKEDDVEVENLTYAVGMGCKLDRKSTTTKPLYYLSSGHSQALRLHHSRPFNGVLLEMDNSGDGDILPDTFDTWVDSFFSYMQLRFSTGAGNYSENMAVKRVGGKVSTVTSQSRVIISVNYLSDSWDGNYTGLVGCMALCVSGSNFLVSRKIKTITQVSINLHQIDMEFDSAFPDTLLTSDRFVVLKKNVNLKVMEKGEAFKDGGVPDVAALYRARSDAFRDFVHHNCLSKDGVSGLIQPLDYLYIGHRSKFSSVMTVFNNYVTDPNDDFANISWALRDVKFLVEYYNGSSWEVAREVVAVPTSVSPVKDYAAVDTGDDKIKCKISFSADNWATGGYVSSLWTAGATTDAPSNIPEENVYLIRIKLLSEVSPTITRVGLGRTDNLQLALTWDGLEQWAPNVVGMRNERVAADTLNISDASLPMFGVELSYSNVEGAVALSDSTMLLRSAHPVTRLSGVNADVFYMALDYPEISELVEDLIILNSRLPNQYCAVPRNMNFLHLMKLILKYGGFHKRQEVSAYMDSFNDVDRNYVNVLGTGYDDVFPVEVGWDAALVNRKFSGMFSGLPVGLISTCARRRNGKYYVWAVKDTQAAVALYSSDDLVTWVEDSANILSNLGTNLILHVEVVCNKESSVIGYYVTLKDGVSGNYKVAVGTGALSALDVATLTDILDDAFNHYGKVSALQLEGAFNTVTANARMLWVEKFSGVGETGGIPTGAPSILLYTNGDAAVTGTWTLRDTKAGYRSPVFLKANYSSTTGAPFASGVQYLNSAFIIAIEEATGKLVRIGNDTNLTSAWASPSLLSDIVLGLGALTCISDGIVYGLRGVSGESAFSLVPTNKDAFILLGVNASGEVEPISVNAELDDWDDAGYWEDQVMEHNEWDWFRTYNHEVMFDRVTGNQPNRTKLYLGFRKPFNKVDCVAASNPYFSILLQARYWNGVEWKTLPSIFQDNKVRTDSKFHYNYGFAFEQPEDWVADAFSRAAEGDTSLHQSIPALYWLEISLGDYASDSDTASIKKISNCYTALFLSKGRALYYMENWDYVRSVYTYPFEQDKKIKIDSIAIDHEKKLAIVNYVEDNPYEMRVVESLTFDLFGKFKKGTPVVLDKTEEGVNQFIVMKDRPESIYRVGLEHEFALSNPDDMSLTTVRAMMVGVWTEDFIKSLYLDGTHTPIGSYASGWNVPVPSEQVMRKYMVRGEPWVVAGESYMREDILNNILIAKRDSLIQQPSDTYLFNDNVARLVASISNCGLLHEELINSPYLKLAPGMYAAMEKNFLAQNQNADLTVLGSVSSASLPVSPAVGDTYILNNGWEIFALVYWNGAAWLIRKPAVGLVIYNDGTAEYWMWTGSGWKELTPEAIWPGRNADNTTYGIGLEWTLGQEGVKLPYFRPYNVRPDNWFNNNVFSEFDYKMATVFRNINISPDWDMALGHDQRNFSSIIGQNFRPTCAALMPDLSSAKVSEGPSGKTFIDGANPGVVFGSYEFSDVSVVGSPSRWETVGVDVVMPIGKSAISVYKPAGKVVDWKKAFYHNGSGFTDLTEDMNYRVGQDLVFDYPTPSQWLYLGLDYRFFGLSFAKGDAYPMSGFTFDLEYWDGATGAWVALPNEISDRLSYLTDTFIKNEDWAAKAYCMTAVFKPFVDNWVKNTVNGVEAYWIRVQRDPASIPNFGLLSWVTCAGYHLWDNMRWWQEHTDIISSTVPSSPDTQEAYAFFDSWAPISIEYDVVRNKVIGSFWNFAADVNKYYPFVMSLDKLKIKGGTYDTWSWEKDKMEILDEEGRDYSYKVQSIQSISPSDSKALLVKETDPTAALIIANIKTFYNGETFFPNDIVL